MKTAPLLTRPRDTSLSLAARQQFADGKGATVFISLHRAEANPAAPVLTAFINRVVEDADLSAAARKVSSPDSDLTLDLAQNDAHKQSEFIAKAVVNQWEATQALPFKKAAAGEGGEYPMSVLAGVRLRRCFA